MRYYCPICHQATDSTEHKDFPFCSERCRLLDLGAWASGKYKVSEPAPSLPEDTELDGHRIQ